MKRTPLRIRSGADYRRAAGWVNRQLNGARGEGCIPHFAFWHADAYDVPTGIWGLAAEFRKRWGTRAMECRLQDRIKAAAEALAREHRAGVGRRWHACRPGRFDLPNWRRNRPVALTEGETSFGAAENTLGNLECPECGRASLADADPEPVLLTGGGEASRPILSPSGYWLLPLSAVFFPAGQPIGPGSPQHGDDEKSCRRWCGREPNNSSYPLATDALLAVGRGAAFRRSKSDTAGGTRRSSRRLAEQGRSGRTPPRDDAAQTTRR